MRVRLALAAMALTAVPLAGTSHASTCNYEMFPEVCARLDALCQSRETIHNICRQFG
jgi:hypothetical protein